MSHLPYRLFDIPGYQVKYLEFEDTPDLQTFLEKSPDYSLLTTGSPPTPFSAISLLTECPEGKKPNDKFDIDIYTRKLDLIGLLDTIRNYPAFHDWWVGLLLLDPDHRGRGLGSRVFQAFEKWVIHHGAQRIYLGVIEENRRAYQFWQKLGFEPVERRPGKLAQGPNHIIIEMERILM